jgi:hypothetical protein
MNAQPEHIATVASEAPAFRSAAVPLTFCGTVGHFMPADEPLASSATAVLILASWGFEEMCTRKFWRIIADDLAARNVPSLRFDYPGTGDALDEVDLSAGLSVWEDCIWAAADRLRALSGCDRLIILAEGLGAPLALSAARNMPDIDGMGLFAPVLSGRAYLRELSAWSRMIDDNLGLGAEHRPSGVSIAGLTMPDAIAAAVRQISIDGNGNPPTNYLVLTRAGPPPAQEFAATLERGGGRVESRVFDGYEQMISNVTYARPPIAAIAGIVDWVDRLKRPPAAGATGLGSFDQAAPLLGDGYRETPVRLGPAGRLSGILCEPHGERRGATLLIVGTAYERHTSWGRMMAHLARDVARSGIASLRFDGANIGDSPPVPGAPEQILYSEFQNADVAEAMTFLGERGHRSTVAVGRCSGGYLAFRSAVLHAGVSGAVLVNPFAFHFDNRQSVDDLLKFVPKSFISYAPKAMRLATWKRMLRGEIKLVNATVNIRRALGRKLLAKLPASVRRLLASSEFRDVERSFARLKARNVGLSLLYSEKDVGLAHFHQHFGADGEGLKRFPNVRFQKIADADHNLSPPAARQIFHDEVRAVALAVGSD